MDLHQLWIRMNRFKQLCHNPTTESVRLWYFLLWKWYSLKVLVWLWRDFILFSLYIHAMQTSHSPHLVSYGGDDHGHDFDCGDLNGDGGAHDGDDRHHDGDDLRMCRRAAAAAWITPGGRRSRAYCLTYRYIALHCYVLHCKLSDIHTHCIAYCLTYTHIALHCIVYDTHIAMDTYWCILLLIGVYWCKFVVYIGV